MYMGDIIAINGYRVSLKALKRRCAEVGYQLQATAHFLLFTREEVPTTIIVHWFAPENIDADLGYYLMQELHPLGIVKHPQDLGNIFGAVVESIFPFDVRSWYLYATNTLRRYQYLMKQVHDPFLPRSNMSDFASIYHRVCELLVGKRFLDAGCGYGFLPLIVAERFPSFTKILGIDIEASHFPVIRAIAEERQLRNIHFAQVDLLASDFGSIGRFDTVVALHVLEHFTEVDSYRVLANLLAVTAQRLIVAVPYEEGEPEQVYGHLQLFSPSKLKAVGEWCVQQLAGAARMQYEDCVDGLLVIERL